MSLSVVLQQASPGKIASGPREDKRDPIVIVQVGVSQLGEQQDAGMVEQGSVALREAREVAQKGREALMAVRFSADAREATLNEP